jgi:hypothetical protein
MFGDNYEPNPMYEAEREEARDARRAAGPMVPCYRHDFRPDGRGGGICSGCGETLDPEEL